MFYGLSRLVMKSEYQVQYDNLFLSGFEKKYLEESMKTL